MKLFTSLVLLAALPAAAAWPEVGANLSYAGNVNQSRNFDLVSSTDHLALTHVAASVTFAAAKGRLDVELAYETGGVGDSAHQSIPTQLSLQGFELGATWRYPLLQHLEPYAHLGGELDWVNLTLIDTQHLTQTVANPGVNGLLGVQVPLSMGISAARPGTLLLDIGVGYVLRPSYAFHALSPQVAGRPADPVAQSPVDLGSMPMSGISYRIGVSFRI